MRVYNQNVDGKVFYGLHMVPGVAEYREAGKEPHRILVGEDACKLMDPTMRGCPMPVLHVDNEQELEKNPAEIAGYVVESFYNKFDGKHWAKFIIINDAGLQAIAKGWTLSNSYLIKDYVGGGTTIGVDYDKEVMRADYKHLALVPNPRYEQSIILTPEDFKLYNEKKELELNRLANSKDEGESSMKLNFWKRSKIDNAKELDLESLMVELPKSKKEMSVLEVVNALDEIKVQNMDGYANDSHMVKCEEGEMSVKDMVGKYNAMMAKQKENAGGEGEEAEVESLDNAEDEEEKKKKEAEAMKNAEDEKKKNEEDVKSKKEEEERAKNAKSENLKRLKNAQTNAQANVQNQIAETSDDRVARGKSRYGSN